jgi:hypothetical protein
MTQSKKSAQFPVEFASYVESPRFSATLCATVARQLLNSMAEGASAEERTAMDAVIAASEAVVAVITERERAGVGKVRPSMLAFTNAWSGVSEVLGGFGRAEGPVGDEARTLSETLFVDGVAFVQLEAGAAWSEGRRRVARIDAEGLAPRLEALIGTVLLTQMRTATEKLGNAIGAGTELRDVPSRTALAEAVDEFGTAVAAYARVAAAKVDVRDAESVQRFKKAMTPLDEYRASRKGHADDDDVVDTTSTVPVAPGLPGGSPFVTQ